MLWKDYPDYWVGLASKSKLAKIYVQVGRHEAAIDLLEQLLTEPSWLSVPLVRIDPLWNPLRGNPRFEALLDGG